MAPMHISGSASTYVGRYIHVGSYLYVLHLGCARLSFFLGVIVLYYLSSCVITCISPLWSKKYPERLFWDATAVCAHGMDLIDTWRSLFQISSNATLVWSYLEFALIDLPPPHDGKKKSHTKISHQIK
jgi:hypothetical protein